MILIDGKAVANSIKESIKNEILIHKYSITLAVLQIGKNSASDVYVEQKRKIADYLGINFIHEKFDENDDEEQIIKKINELNYNDFVNGIIIQLPISQKFDTSRIINTVLPSKDVDGLTKNSEYTPCTPLGITKLLEYYNINVSGKNAVIIGRSNLVSKPLFNILLNMDSTVTMCHSKTKNISFYTKNADILISASGVKHLITENMVKKGSIIIDVGITRENNKLYGDVDFDNVSKKASYITPVPGGVGPMTVIMLMNNTLESYKKAFYL